MKFVAIAMLSVFAVAACETRSGEETARGVDAADTIVTTEQNVDTAIVTQDTSVDVDTVQREGDGPVSRDTIQR
jgi:hypothetical protein